MDPVNSIDALAEVWASIDGKIELFQECRSDPIKEEELGYFEGYLADAHEMISRLDKLGYAIIQKPKGETE